MGRDHTLAGVAAVVVISALSLAAAVGAGSVSTQPSRPYRLFRRSVAGSNPMRSDFVVVSPDGYPTLSTFEKLRWSIEHAVNAPATLRWEPSDARMADDPEPLDDEASERSLADFCKGRGITFVHVPAG